MIGSLVGIIDDDPSMRDAMSWALRAVGLRTTTYESACAFLEQAVPADLACLILDLMMPGMGGVELQARLNGLPDAPPIVVISAHAGGETESQVLAHGAVAFLTKPFTADELVAAVRDALASPNAVG